MPDAPALGVVFDCDGTLADTEPISDRAWADVLGELGYVPTAEDRRTTVGRPYAVTFAHFAQHVALGDPEAFRVRLRARFRARFDTELELFDDVVGTLRSVAAEGLGVAVASSSTRAHVELILERAGLGAEVHAIVGAEDVVEHKPHPEPYLLAATRLGVPPARCRAVEDTVVGVTSARAAGMYTVAVVRGHVSGAELAHADRVVTSLSVSDLALGSGVT
jgi:HAD superfamily hydrolase (TIGR01509 family)